MSSDEERAARQEKFAREYNDRYEANTDYAGHKAQVERAKQNRKALKQIKQAAKRLRKTG